MKGSGGSVMPNAKDDGEAALSGGVSSEENGKMGSARDAKNGDAGDFSRGSPEGNRRRRGLACANAGTRVPDVPREFFPWMCLEREVAS